MTRTPLRRRMTAIAVASATAMAMTTGTAVAQNVGGSTLYQGDNAANFSSGSAENHSPYVTAFTIFGQIAVVAGTVAAVIALINAATGGQLPAIQLPELSAQ